MTMHNDAPTVAAPLSAITPAEVGGLVDAQTEARAIVRSASPTVRKLFDAIRESGSSEPDIADAAGVSHATLHYWRAGNRSPTIMLLEAVASVLGYNIELVKADHATALAAKDAELAAANDAWRAMKDRAHAAEAQLTEARKALASNASTFEAIRTHIDERSLPLARGLCSQGSFAARRALEGGQEE